MLSKLREVVTAIKKASGGATQNIRCTSGSLTVKSMKDLIEALCINPEYHVLFDVGAGEGFVVLCACMVGFKSAAGCEYKENEYLRSFFKAAADRLGCAEKANVTFEAFSEVPLDATVVFTFNAVFNPDTQHLIVQKVVESNAKYFICCRNKTLSNESKILEALDDQFETVKIVKAKMQGSGARHTFFVLKRKD